MLTLLSADPLAGNNRSNIENC